ncbi:MAG: hypothetical protein K0R97_1558, partial [Oerskovia sp.]|nr:hypothetical protein [Oerskovia sp.]
TAETFDPTFAYVTVSSGGAEGSQVFDAANEISSTPSTSVLPGQSMTFPVVFGVTDPADLTMAVNVGAWEYDAVLFSTTSGRAPPAEPTGAWAPPWRPRWARGPARGPAARAIGP